MIKQKIALIALFSLFSLSANSQGWESTLKLEYFHHNNSYFSLGYSMMDYNFKKVRRTYVSDFESSHGPSFSVAFRLKNKFNMTYALGYEYSKNIFFFRARGGMITDYRTADLFVSPNIGFSISGIFNLYYGHNLYLHKNIYSSGPSFGFIWNIPFDLDPPRDPSDVEQFGRKNLFDW